MPAAQRTIEIARPVQEVFAFFSDPANDPSWRSGVKEIHAHGAPEVGAVVHQTVAGPMGRGIPADIEITAYEPGVRYAFRGVSGPVRPVGEYRFAPTGSGTSVTFSLSADLGGLKGVVLAKQVQRTMDREVASLDRAKALLET